jgi:cytochrome c5
MTNQTSAFSTVRALALLALLALMVTLLAACGGSSQPTPVPPAGASPAVTTPAIDAASLLDTRCSVCHPSTRAKTAQKTQAEWEQTVTRMIGKGAQLTDAEKAALVDYLTKNYGK